MEIKYLLKFGCLILKNEFCFIFKFILVGKLVLFLLKILNFVDLCKIFWFLGFNIFLVVKLIWDILMLFFFCKKEMLFI